MAVPISNVTRRAVYAPSGAGGVGPYAFTFEILANTDIAVYKDDVLLTLTTHYTVTINANGTGSVTITAAGLALSPTSPTQYAIVGNRTIARSTDFTTGGDFFANTINDELDQQTIFAQQNAEGLQRALTAPQTDPTTINMTLPAKATRANKTLSFDANGNPSAGVSAADVANAVTYATNAANSATAAASSASSASSSASAASASASTASTQASNASTSATNASNSASSASTSATNAASSASTATTQASNASTSATNAASSASAASTSASNAATSETNAAASASTASTQASNAATSASSASSSATSAANSAAAAASALDSFDDRYLGTKTSDPTLDNDGNALVAGALYFSTTQNVMKVYDGASWITATSAGATSLLRFRYVATSGQTTFSGADSAAATLTYTVNNIAVHRNGVTLDTSEYTASNGTSIVLNVAAGTGDIVDIIAFKSFTVADALSAVSGGTVNGGVNITGNVGIGTASPASDARLTLASPTTESYVMFSRTNSGVFDAAVGNNAGSLVFKGGADSATVAGLTEFMRIDSSGNVGIGTSSPVGRLGVVSTGGNSRLSIGDTAASTYSTMLMYGGSGKYNFQLGVQNNVNNAFEITPSTAAGGTTFSTPAMVIDTSGNLLVGTTSAGGSKFRVNSAGLAGAFYVTAASTTATEAIQIVKFDNNSTTAQVFQKFYINDGASACGQINANGANTAAFGSTSDSRLKENIVDLPSQLDNIMSLRPVEFDYIESEGGGHQIGFIAQEVQAIYPDLVGERADGMFTLTDMNKNDARLIKAIQELKALVDTQASTITSLTDRLTALENK